MLSRYGFVVAQSGGTRVVASVNGIPLRDTTMPLERAKNSTNALDHWVMPGPNVVTLEVPSGVVRPDTSINVTVWDAVEKTYPAEIHWPRDFTNGDPALLEQGAGPRQSVSLPFVIPDDHARPLYMDAPARAVSPAGDDDTWAPILAFHSAFERGDREGVIEGLSLRASEWTRHYQSKMSEPGTVRALVDKQVPGPYRMLPLVRGATVFEPIAAGRMLRVRRLDGLPLIAGKCLEPGAGAPAELAMPFLIFHDDRYQLLF